MKIPAGMTCVGYRPKVGMPTDSTGRLILEYQFAPIPRAKPDEAKTAPMRGLLL